MRVLHVLRFVQTMPATPVFRSVVEAEALLASGLAIASEELAHVRATLAVEAARERQESGDREVEAAQESRRRTS